MERWAIDIDGTVLGTINDEPDFDVVSPDDVRDQYFLLPGAFEALNRLQGKHLHFITGRTGEVESFTREQLVEWCPSTIQWTLHVLGNKWTGWEQYIAWKAGVIEKHECDVYVGDRPQDRLVAK